MVKRASELMMQWRPVWVWMLRIVIGGVFILSGLSKSIDLWGTIFKIEEYLAIWDCPQPRVLTLTASMLLCGGEFVLGALLLTGCYRRGTPWLLTAVMAVMLPLSLWIWMDDPVADCGCFGDALTLTNRQTFWKNVAITLGLICLLRSNTKVAPGISPYVQWIAGAIFTVYIVIIGIAGYSIQPMIDFRRFPQGVSLTGNANSAATEQQEQEEEEPTYEFIYERDGKTITVSDDDELPDSTWQFVERRLTSGSEAVNDGFAILDDGTDITSDVISGEGAQLLVVVPEPGRVNPSHTFAINRLDEFMTRRGGNLTALLAPDQRGIEYWKDLSMADYPVYTAEPTLLKELVRGNPGLVYLRDGVIVWKRTFSSIDIESLVDGTNGYTGLNDPQLIPPGITAFQRISTLTLTLILLLIMADRTGLALRWLWRRKKKTEQ